MEEIVKNEEVNQTNQEDTAAKIKELIIKCGGSTKFARRINAPLTTVAQWFYGANACKKWMFDIIVFAIEKGYFSPDFEEKKKSKIKCMYEVNDGSSIFYYGKKLTDAKEIISDCLNEMPNEKIYLKRNDKLIWQNGDDTEILTKLKR